MSPETLDEGSRLLITAPCRRQLQEVTLSAELDFCRQFSQTPKYPYNQPITLRIMATSTSYIPIRSDGRNCPVCTESCVWRGHMNAQEWMAISFILLPSTMKLGLTIRHLNQRTLLRPSELNVFCNVYTPSRLVDSSCIDFAPFFYLHPHCACKTVYDGRARSTERLKLLATSYQRSFIQTFNTYLI